MTAKRVVIVDDEDAARLQLRSVIDTMPELTVAAEVSDGAAAIDAITQHQPDIVFLDIDMPGVDGFAVARATEALMYQLVFVTAHHQYALQAFQTNAIDYLLKPARPSRIESCLKKVLRQEVLTLQHAAPSAHSPGLVLSDSGDTHILDAEHVLYVEGLGRYRRIHLSAQGAAVHRRDTLISDTTLEQFSQRLEAHSFIRVHRSYLVNLNHIASLKTRGRGHEIYLAGVDIAIPVARSRLGALKRAVGIAP